jgi:hypothetical protein
MLKSGLRKSKKHQSDEGAVFTNGDDTMQVTVSQIRVLAETEKTAKEKAAELKSWLAGTSMSNMPITGKAASEAYLKKEEAGMWIKDMKPLIQLVTSKNEVFEMFAMDSKQGVLDALFSDD